MNGDGPGESDPLQFYKPSEASSSQALRQARRRVVAVRPSLHDIILSISPPVIRAQLHQQFVRHSSVRCNKLFFLSDISFQNSFMSEAFFNALIKKIRES